MTCKRENNILCDSNGSHLSGQTQKTFFCSSASALSLPSSVQCLKSSDAALSCRRGTDPLQLSQVSVYMPWGNENNSKPCLSFPSHTDKHPGPSFLPEVPNGGHRGWAERKAHMLLHCCQCPHGHLTQAGSAPHTPAVVICAWVHPHTAKCPSATHPEAGDSGIKQLEGT